MGEKTETDRQTDKQTEQNRTEKTGRTNKQNTKNRYEMFGRLVAILSLFVVVLFVCVVVIIRGSFFLSGG